MSYYLIFPFSLVNEIKWPEKWGNQCVGNLPEMLREHLNYKRGISGEIKLIWNHRHRMDLIKDYNVTSEDLDNYVASNCSMLKFKTPRIKERALRALIKMGAKTYVLSENYRDVILQQAFYKKKGRFDI